MRRVRVAAWFVLLVAGSVLQVAAQSTSPETPDKADVFLREHNEKLAKKPEGLLFTVRLKDNRKQFHLGEIITLELSFAASKPDAFTLDAATYDRSGRLHSDGFVIDQRDAAVDPLDDYFYSGLRAYMMGGLRGIPDLTDKPYVITADLNEWRRIDKPGHYRLYVVSGRVGTKKKEKASFWNTDGPAVASNVIEFDILPADAKWSRQKLNDAVAVLAKPQGDRETACRTMRFLATTAAVTEMIKRFRGDDKQCEWDYKFGLIGSPHRELVIREMENAISFREQPVTSHFIDTLALMEFVKRAGPQPQYVERDEESSQARWKQREAIYEQLRLDHLRQLVIAIPQKQGQARATSLQTLLDSRSELNSGDFPQWSTLLASLSEVFTRLPLDAQLRVLQYQWRPVATAAMVPVLREVLKYSYPAGQKQDEVFDQFWQQELRSVAVRRLYELSPDEGRRLIVEQLRDPKPRLDQAVLLSLPDETLPELNNVLIANFEESHRTGRGYFDEQSEFIERYATDAILARVRAVYESSEAGKWACRPQNAMLAYFLRVAPEVGGDYLNKALAARGKGYSRCYEDMLKTVAALHMSAHVEQAATAALDSDDEDVLAHAVAVLGEYGSADAEKALWSRFEKWHEAMLGRTSQEELSAGEEKIENAFREALTRGQAWLAEPEKLKRVRALCFSEKSRNEIDQMISGWSSQIYVSADSFDEDTPRFGVAQYPVKSLDAFKQKLLQFPKGTEFEFTAAPARGDEAKWEQVLQQIEKYLAENGMTLKRTPAPAPEK